MANAPKETPKTPSPRSLHLDEALGGWFFYVIAAGALVGVGILYLVGFIPEAVAAVVVAIGAPLIVTVVMARSAWNPGRDAGGRAQLWAVAAVTFLFAAVPATQAILPGSPLFQGEVGIEGESIPIPAGVSGRIRILVNGKLREGADPTVSFRLEGGEQPIEGKLERTYGYTRVGRGGRARVSRDHNSDWYEGKLPAGTAALRLAQLRGQLGGRMQVSVYRDWLPHGLLLAVVLGTLCWAAIIDARLGLKGNTAVAAGMSLVFGLLVSYNATPVSAVGPAVGAVVLGAMGGSLSGWLIGLMARQLVPHAKRRSSLKPGRQNGVAAA